MPISPTRFSTKQHTIALAIAVSVMLSLASPVSAQITRAVDEHGKTVFVNADSPKPRRGSTISSASSSSPNSAAASSAQKSPETPALLVNPFEDAEHRYVGPPQFVAQTARVTKKTVSPYDSIIAAAAERHHVDAGLVKAVIDTESGWNARAISHKGAVGLMQLIPETAQRYGARNSFDPVQNVEAGTTYLKSLLDRYDNDLIKTLAAYNAGEGAVDRNGGVPAYPETQKYVQKVTDRYYQSASKSDSTQWTPPRTPLRKNVDSSGRVTFTNE